MDNIIPKKITIIGVGLIGGSIALNIKKQFGAKITILGCCNDPKRALLAKKRGIIDKVITLEKRLPTSCQLIIISTPILSVIRIVKKINHHLTYGSLIIDTASTKEFIGKEIEKIKQKKFF